MKCVWLNGSKGVVLVDPNDENLLLLGFKRCGLLVEWSLRDAKGGVRYQGLQQRERNALQTAHLFRSLGPACLEAACFKRDGKMLIAGYQDGSVVMFSRDGKVEWCFLFCGLSCSHQQRHRCSSRTFLPPIIDR